MQIVRSISSPRNSTPEHPPRVRDEFSSKRRVFLLGFAIILLGASGCSRQFYRHAADRDAQSLLESRLIDPLWDMPLRPVDPHPTSRFALNSDPDCGLRPLDDLAANCWMRHPYRFHNHDHWDQIPIDSEVECPAWLDYLPRQEGGQVLLSPELALDLALLHNREFQTRYEQVYLTALSLSGNRFEFDTQWAGGLGADYSAASDGASASRLLDLSDRLGFGRQLAAGGEFATNLVNSFVFELGSGALQHAGGGLVASFTQPLLRGAGRFVRLEALTQAERNLLYDVRDFARFRREFYFDVTSRYYDLLAQVQSIRNLRANLESLDLNLREHEELFARKMVSQIQVDQVFQDYQNGRTSLYSAEQRLADSSDAFKFLLGLPSWLTIEFDESLLDSFDFASTDIQQLDAEAQALYVDLLAHLPPDLPDRETLQKWLHTRDDLRARAGGYFPVVAREFADWQTRTSQRAQATLSSDDRFDLQQQMRLQTQLQERLADVGEALKRPPQALNSIEILALMDQGNTEMAWRSLLEDVNRNLQDIINDLFIAESQIRLFQLDIDPVTVDPKGAVAYAQQHRLDAMNSRAQVTDAFRRVEVAANALRSQLDISGQAALATDPTKDNAFRLDSSAATYRLGVQFDGPLNRLNERNAYRAAQLAYQQSRRQFIAVQDTVANAVRSDLRALQISRLNFQIARQQYVAVTRQVDEAKFNLRTSNQANSNLTRDLLTSLQGLLAARNNLVSNWIDFKVSKIRLFVDLELLYLDPQGQWINEAEGLRALQSEPAVEVPSNTDESADEERELGAAGNERYSGYVQANAELPPRHRRRAADDGADRSWVSRPVVYWRG